jgi:hypothetical protein
MPSNNQRLIIIMEDSEYFTVNELTEKLKEQVVTVQSKSRDLKNENDAVSKENLEKFIIEKTSNLVNEGLDTIRELKSIFVSNPNAEEIDSLAQAFKAVSGALSVLKDIQVANSKINNNIELKEMDIKSKKELAQNKNESDTPKLLFTREEIIKSLVEKSEIIEAEFEKVSG